MLSHSPRSQTPQRRAPSSSRGGGDEDQALYGNSFMAAGMGTGPTFEDGTPIPTQQGSEVTEDHDPANRVSSVRQGAWGALIGQGEDVEVRSGRTRRSRELARVPDGAPAQVLEVNGKKLKVRIRHGDKNIEGWVDAAVFSDQPDLYRDEDNKSLVEDWTFSYFGGDQSPQNPTGKDTAQGGLGDCFFIASMAAIANTSPDAIKDAIKFDEKSGKYTVRFYEESYSGMKPVYITVDGYLPTAKGTKNDPAYAGDPGGPLWPAIMEKAYAKWKGGYDVIGEGGTGDVAMAEITGVRSRSKNPRSMREEDVIPFFTQAKKDNLAIYAGVRDSKKMETQAPLTGTGAGPYTGTLRQTHKWNEVQPGTLEVSDKEGKVRPATDNGQEGDKTADVDGSDVKSGSIDYKANRLEIEYAKAPSSGSNLQVDFEYHGMIDANKVIIGNHAYAFEAVVDGDKLQFYNPWGVGSYQPKPVTAAEFLEFFDSLSTNAVPKGKTQA